MRKIMIVCLMAIHALWSQSFFLPVDYTRITEKHTRTTRGIPGEKYWQNHARYEMKVRVDTDKDHLYGEEKIVYFNQSPDTLKNLILRLYQNVNKIGSARDWNVGKDFVHDGVIIETLKVRGDTVNTKKLSQSGRMMMGGGTNQIVPLDRPLLPGDSVDLFVRWNFPIPDSIRIRMGKYKTGAYFIAYWYPQVAVYDDVDGWDMNQYFGTTEFYNDFNDYSLEISVPEHFYVWATGDCENEEDVYPPHVLDRIRTARAVDTTVRILTKDDWKNASDKIKTWKFAARQVPDVAFIIADRYIWDGSSVVVDSLSGRRTMVNLLYPEGARHYSEVMPETRKILHFFSHDLPGVPYPYSHSTNFCNGEGGGGMEFPMLTNDGTPSEKPYLIGLLAHEIGHTYFPFYMGINERKYAWMDEGWATFITSAFMATLDTLRSDIFGNLGRRYASNGATSMDIPLYFPSAYLRSSAYRFTSYSRGSMAYATLLEVLGPEQFRKSLRQFMETWHHKHPVPTDLIYSFENTSGKKLDWLWSTWFFGVGAPDLSLSAVTLEKKKAEITVTNVGGFPLPVIVHILYADSSQDTFKKPITLWESGIKEITLEIPLKGKVTDIWLEDKVTADIHPANNRVPLNKK